MIIDIQDVGHGACAVATFPNGARIMIDAGQRWDRFWAPSVEYLGQPMDLLVLGNLDEDYVEILPAIGRIWPLAYQSQPRIGEHRPGRCRMWALTLHCAGLSPHGKRCWTSTR